MSINRHRICYKHYDTLSWQTGNIFIAGILVFTGLALGKDSYEILKEGWSSLVIVIGIPFISFVVLKFWFCWFKRHRALYQFRDDVLHRLEIKLGFYHFLRVEAERQKQEGKTEDKRLTDASKIAYKSSKPLDFLANGVAENQKTCENNGNGESYKSFLDSSHKSPSSYQLVYRLSFTLPCIQFVALFLLWWFEMGKANNLLIVSKPCLNEEVRWLWYVVLVFIIAVVWLVWREHFYKNPDEL